jgi:hypothetical protein
VDAQDGGLITDDDRRAEKAEAERDLLARGLVAAIIDDNYSAMSDDFIASIALAKKIVKGEKE